MLGRHFEPAAVYCAYTLTAGHSWLVNILCWQVCLKNPLGCACSRPFPADDVVSAQDFLI